MVLQVVDRRHDGRPLALKLLRGDRPTELARWEFAHLRQLEHPHLSRVRDLDQVTSVEGDGPVEVELGTPFLAQDLVAGQPADRAAEQLRDDAEPFLRWVVRLGASVCRALTFLHERGRVHRDVKPANVIVDDDPSAARLIDLSLAASAASGALPAGTIGYMAPEALTGTAEPRSDLWSLGVMLWELVVGRRPFSGYDRSATVRSILAGTRPPALGLEASGAERLGELLDRLLAPEPSGRPPSARAVLLELARIYGPEVVGVDAGPLGAVASEDELRAEPEWAALRRDGPVLGRSAELELLLTLSSERLDPLGRGSPVMVVAGAAGVGKSTLIREALQRLKLRAMSASTPPPQLLRGTVRQVAAMLRDEAGPRWSSPRLSVWLGEAGVEASTPADAAALSEEIARLISAAAARRPLVVHLDGDRSSTQRDLVAFLHRRVEVEGLEGERRAPLALIVEQSHEPGQVADVLEGVPLVELRPLGDEEIRHIIADRLGRDLPEQVTAAAVAAARGRPLLLFAFLTRAAATAPLRQLSERELAQVQLPADVSGALAQAAAILRPEALEALAALSLWGRPAGASELAALLELDHAGALDGLGELWRAGWVEPTERGSLTLRAARGDLSAIVARLGGDWARGVHRRALRLLDEVAPADLSARARHALAAELDEAGSLCLAAGRELLAAGDPTGAADHLEGALARGDEATAAAAEQALRRALSAAGRYEEAIDRWRIAAEQGEAGASIELARLFRLTGHVDVARQWAEAALGGGEPVEARALLARLALDRGDAHQALEVIGGASEVGADLPGVAALEEVAGLARLALGELDAARDHFHACLTLARSGAAGTSLARASNLLGMVAHQREQWAEAADHYGEAEALAREAGHVHAAATYGVNLATARLETGELDTALTALRRSVTTLAGLGRPGELAGALYNYASLLEALGDVEGGLRVHARALAAAREADARQVIAYCDLLEADLARRRPRGRADLEVALEAAARASAAFAALGARREQCLAELASAEVELEMGRAAAASEALARAEALVVDAGEPLEMRVRAALTAGRLALLGEAPIAESSARIEHLAGEIGDGEPREVLWRLEVVGARLCERRGELESARAAAGRAAVIIERRRQHVPEAHRSRWEDDHDRRELAALRQRLVAEPAAPAPAVDQSAAWRRLLDINKRLNSELRLGRLLDEIIDTIVSLTDAERGFLLLRGRDGTLRARSARNVDRRSLDSDDLRVSRSIAEQVVATGAPVLTVDAQSDERFDTAASVHALRLRSILAVPLRVKGEAVGAVYVDDQLRPGAFGEGALEMALAVADQAAIAIENTRLLSENKRRQRKIERLNRQLRRELDSQRGELDQLRREVDGQRRELATKYSYDAIIARSAAMAKVFSILDRVTDSDVPVVIQGESGTGKELVARAIHFNGPRKERAFVTENCGAIPETLLESVLFGHVKGAFTGADRERKGLFEVASGGTLLLDEISEMSPAMQAKLLRVLQEGELRPVGGNATVAVDVRVITSSNRDLAELVRGGEFREDLFYRLNVITVRLPPLRERAEDVPLLVEHFVEKHGGGRVSGVDRAALRRLVAHRWPGNVRQLENEVMRAVVLTDDLIGEEHLSPEIVEGAAVDRPDDLDLKAQVEALERELLGRALERFDFNQTKAAAALGLSRYGLQKKLTRYAMRRK